MAESEGTPKSLADTARTERARKARLERESASSAAREADRRARAEQAGVEGWLFTIAGAASLAWGIYRIVDPSVPSGGAAFGGPDRVVNLDLAFSGLASSIVGAILLSTGSLIRTFRHLANREQ